MEDNIDLKRQALIYGVLLGVINFVLGIAYMYIAKDITSFMTFYTVTFVMNFVLFIAIVVYFVIRLRKVNGGYWSFKTSLQNIFIMLAVSVVLSTLGTSMYNAVFPDLQASMIDNSLNLTIESMESFGADDDAIDEAVAKIEQERDALGQITIGQVIKGIFISLLMYFVFALILAAIFKKEKPIFQKSSLSGSAAPSEDIEG